MYIAMCPKDTNDVITNEWMNANLMAITEPLITEANVPVNW